jgi:hypothetical protein
MYSFTNFTLMKIEKIFNVILHIITTIFENRMSWLGMVMGNRPTLYPRTWSVFMDMGRAEYESCVKNTDTGTAIVKTNKIWKIFFQIFYKSWPVGSTRTDMKPEVTDPKITRPENDPIRKWPDRNWSDPKPDRPTVFPGLITNDGHACHL